MLDINFLREKPELVKSSETRRGRDPKIVDEVLKVALVLPKNHQGFPLISKRNFTELRKPN